MGCNRNNYAVSEVVGYIIVLNIIVSTIGIIFLWYEPTIERDESIAQTNAVCGMLKKINGKNIELLDQGMNASASGNLLIEEGNFEIIPLDGDQIVIYYSMDENYDFLVDDFDDSNLQEFNLKMKYKLDFLCKAVKTNLDDMSTVDDDEDIPTISEWVTFDFNDDAVKMLKIDLLDRDEGDLLFGRIWVFDMGCLEYSLPTSQGTYKAICENNAVIFSYPNNPYMYEKPVTHNADDIFLKVFQTNIKEESISGVSGTSDIDFLISVDDTYVHESRMPVYSFYIQVNGEYPDPWLNYFKNYFSDYEFIDVGGMDPENTIQLKISGDFQYFSLVRMISDYEMKVK